MVGFRPRSERQTKKLDYRATPDIFVGYSIWTKQYFVYDPLARTLHSSRDVVFRGGKWYTAPNAADEAILNEHFYRDVIEKPKPKPAHIEKQPTKHQAEEPLDNSPPDPPKSKMKSRKLAGLETSLGDAWKPPAEGSCQNCAAKLAETAQLAPEDEEFENLIPIHSAAAIPADHKDAIDPKSQYQRPSLCSPRNGIRQ